MARTRNTLVLVCLVALLACADAKKKKKDKSPTPPARPPPAPPVGVAAVDLIAVAAPGGARNVSTSGESNLADLYCAALLGDPLPRDSKNYEVCILNGGGFRANIPTGNITAKALLKAYPFPRDTLVRLQISGDTLLKALEHGVNGYPTGGAFPQIGNLRYSFLPVPNFSSATGFATSIVSAQLLAGNVIYGVGGSENNVILTTNSWMAAGNDGYEMLKGAKVLSRSTSTINELVGAYIKKETPVGAAPDGRIVDCSVTPTDTFCVPQRVAPSGGSTPSGKPASAANNVAVTAAAVVAAVAAPLLLF